jgi:F-type H+-transporting ATPase subunit b
MLHDPKFWLAVAFFIFVGAAIKYIIPVVIKMIDQKRNQISENLNQANELRLSALKLLEEAEKYYQDSITLSSELIERARKESEIILESSKKVVEAELNTKMNLATQKIKQEEEKAIRQMKSAIVSAAIKTIEDSLFNSDNKKISQGTTNKAISNISKLIH